MKLTFTRLKPPGGIIQKNLLKHLLALTVLVGLLLPNFALAQSAPCSITTLNITGPSSGGNSNKGLIGNFGTPTTPAPAAGSYTITVYKLDATTGGYTVPSTNTLVLTQTATTWTMQAQGGNQLEAGSYVAIYRPNASFGCTPTSITSAPYCYTTSQTPVLSGTPTISIPQLFNSTTLPTTVSGTSQNTSGTVSLYINGAKALLADGVSGIFSTISANGTWSINIPVGTVKVGDVITTHALVGTSCLSLASNSIQVYGAPAITGSYCAPLAPATATVNLTGTGVAGSTIRLYNDNSANTTAPANAGALTTSPATITVGAGGTWTAAVAGVNNSFSIKAIASNTNVVQSDYSNSAVINAQPTPKTVNFSSNAICSGGTVTANIESSELNVVYQVFNNNDPTGNPVIGTGGNISVISGTLTDNASLRVKASYGMAACDIFMPVTPFAVSVTSISPKTINYSNNAICSGGTITAVVLNSELNVSYQIFNNLVASGNVVVGTGGDITLTTSPLTTNANLNVKAVKTVGALTCETYLSGAWFAVTLTEPQSNEGLTVDAPIMTTDGKVSGTFIRNNANIRVYIDGNLLGTTTVVNGIWNLPVSPSRLYERGRISASVQEGTACESRQVISHMVNDIYLPVELLYFTGTQANGKNNLVWSTAMERNNSYFEIQRSTNGMQFKAIGQVAGAGNSLGVKKYSFTDKETLTGTVYYRLKQVDTDQGFEYSKVVALNSSAKTVAQNILAFPNPTNSLVTIIIKPAVSENYSLEIRDLVGKVVLVKEVVFTSQNSETTLDLQHLPAGTYLITARSKKEQVVTRIVKN